MLIIVEGCDATGKTTLTDALAQRATDDGYRSKVIHCGVPQQHPIAEYEYSLTGYKPGGDQSIICDRWHMGADVYGPIKRGDSGLEPAVRWHIEMFLKSRGAYVVHARPISMDDLLHKMRTRGEDYITEDEAYRVVKAFDDVFARSMLGDYAGSIPFDIDKIYVKAMTRALHFQHLSAFPSYIGPLRPKYLLLGDRKNLNNHVVHEAAFTPIKRASGHYLISALLNYKPEVMSTVGIANGSEERLDRLWDALNNPTVIALGSEAKAACELFYVPHRAVAHPAYVKRFKFDQARDYAKEILG